MYVDLISKIARGSQANNLLVMAFAKKKNSIVAKIDNEYQFLHRILEDYVSIIDKNIELQEQESMKVAKECACGDYEVERSVSFSLMPNYDDSFGLLNVFYQAILIMCYSYYESCVAVLEKKAKLNSKELIEAICRTKNITLSEDVKKYVDYLQTDVNLIRNNITHNNFGTYRGIEKMEKISKKNIGFQYIENKMIVDKNFVIEILDKIYLVLCELSDKLGCRK